jgi:hypothetical protein
MMSSQNPNRNTQFRLEGLTGLEHSTSLPEPAGHVTEGQQRLQDRQVLKKNAPKRKRSLSPPRMVGNRPGIHIEYRGMKDGSPWDSYSKIFQLKYNNFVHVAARKRSPRKCVLVKSFAAVSDSQVELEMIHSIRHDHIVSVLETFRFEGSFYVVLERMAISLVQIVASPPYPGEQELAAILGQVNQANMKSRSMC